MKKKNKIIRIAAIVLAFALVAGIGLWIFANQYGKRNFANSMTQEDLYRYNYTLTNYGRRLQYSGSTDVLIVESIHKSLGGNTEIKFQIYSYSNAKLLNVALNLSCEDIAKDERFFHVGEGTVTLLNDKLANMSNMKTMYSR